MRSELFSELGLTPSRILLNAAREGRCAVAALNFYNAETLRAHINAANECNASIILQTTASTIDYLGIELVVAMAGAASRMSSQPIALHLVEIAHRAGVSVEGELGHVTQNADNENIADYFTRPEDARRFVDETGVDALAVAIGTAHGFYKGEVKLDLPRLREIRDAVGDTALVLHGGSGVPDELMRDAIRSGIAKINFGTELKNAFTLAVKGSLAASDDIDLRRTFAPAVKAVEAVSMSKIRVCQLA